MVTAETALVIPLVVVLLAVCLGAMRWGIDQVRCVDAARAGARAAARGDTPAAVHELALRGAPQGAEVTSLGTGDFVTVRVVAPLPTGIALIEALPRPAAAATARLEVSAGAP
ncbi:MAG: pilus assembly protein [Austwickia sp.]|nr:pilus assembly protein [Austwickia sp.]MCO5310550.1 pilus assembly protein [Austwickia sp.]